jgi:ribonuclease J
VPLSQRIKVKNSSDFARVDDIRTHRVFGEELAEHPSSYVLTFRGSMASELQRAQCLSGASAVWSMWTGYLEEPSGRRLRKWLDAHDIALHVLHSSGHATVTDLQRLATALAATQVVPVHTTQAQRYHELFDDVRVRKDGEWWIV